MQRLVQSQGSFNIWYRGLQDTLSFCSLSGVRSMNETLPLERVSEAYQLMISVRQDFELCLPCNSDIKDHHASFDYNVTIAKRKDGKITKIRIFQVDQ